LINCRRSWNAKISLHRHNTQRLPTAPLRDGWLIMRQRRVDSQKEERRTHRQCQASSRPFEFTHSPQGSFSNIKNTSSCSIYSIYSCWILHNPRGCQHLILGSCWFVNRSGRSQWQHALHQGRVQGISRARSHEEAEKQSQQTTTWQPSFPHHRKNRWYSTRWLVLRVFKCFPLHSSWSPRYTTIDLKIATTVYRTNFGGSRVARGVPSTTTCYNSALSIPSTRWSDRSLTPPEVFVTSQFQIA
jgi:hypothetical protein